MTLLSLKVKQILSKFTLTSFPCPFGFIPVHSLGVNNVIRIVSSQSWPLVSFICDLFIPQIIIVHSVGQALRWIWGTQNERTFFTLSTDQIPLENHTFNCTKYIV